MVPRVVPPNFMGAGDMAGIVTMVVANWMGIWLWGLAIFFLIVSLGAHYNCVGSRRMSFAMTWYSFVFPNTGLTTGTFAVGLALESKPFQILGCIFTVALVIVWFFVFGMMVTAVMLKQVLWPEKQEDRDEGGWLMKTATQDGQDGGGAASSDVESMAEMGVQRRNGREGKEHEGPDLRSSRALNGAEKAMHDV